jgi:Domain of unknown function (DUF4389)
MTDQPIFEAQYVEKRSRLTTFFRAILAIPHFIVLYVWSLLAGLAVFIAWFALVITGRYPQALYDFVAGSQRYGTAVYGYLALLTDEYPPFSADTDDYPIHIRIPPPKAEYNRLKVLFRIILAIPVFIIVYAMQIVWEIGAVIAWFVIVIMGKQPKGLQDMIVLGLSYQQRAYAYIGLLTEDWPPFTDPQGETLEGAGTSSGLPPAPATTAPPAAPEAPGGQTGGTGLPPGSSNPFGE